MLKSAIVAICLISVFAGANGVQTLSREMCASSDEGLNMKEFNSGESFYLWTTSSVKVA